MRELVAVGKAAGITTKRFDELWNNHPHRQDNREFVKRKIRSVAPGNHEWIPLRLVNEVVQHAASLEGTGGLKWIEAMNEFRTPTDLIVFTRFDMSKEQREIVVERAAGRARDQVDTEAEGDGTAGEVEGTQVGADTDEEESPGGAVHPGSALEEATKQEDVAIVSIGREPFHKILEDLFDETKNDSPEVFLKAVLSMVRGDLLWDGEGAKGDDTPIENMSWGDLLAASPKFQDAVRAAKRSSTSDELSVDGFGHLAEQLQGKVIQHLKELIG